MKDLETKESILQEIMDLMSDREGDDLKKHPKLMAAKIEVAKPEVDPSEPKVPSDVLAEKDEDEEITPDQIKALLAHFKDLK